MEVPNLQLSVFLEVCDTLRLNRVSTDANSLRLFPFSVSDKAQAWLHSFLPGSIKTWDELITAFLAKFFPPSKTTTLSNQITTFAHSEHEMLYEAWEQLKDLLLLCLTMGSKNG